MSSRTCDTHYSHYSIITMPNRPGSLIYSVHAPLHPLKTERSTAVAAEQVDLHAPSNAPPLAHGGSLDERMSENFIML